MKKWLIVVSYLFVLSVMCACYPEPNQTHETAGESFDDGTPIIQNDTRVIVVVGDPDNKQGNIPLVDMCGMSCTLTYFLNDQDQKTDVVDFENFIEGYLETTIFHDKTGMVIAQDKSCPR